MPPELVNLIEEGMAELGLPGKLHTVELPPPQRPPQKVKSEPAWKPGTDPDGCRNEM